MAGSSLAAVPAERVASATGATSLTLTPVPGYRECLNSSKKPLDFKHLILYVALLLQNCGPAAVADATRSAYTTTKLLPT